MLNPLCDACGYNVGSIAHASTCTGYKYISELGHVQFTCAACRLGLDCIASHICSGKTRASYDSGTKHDTDKVRVELLPTASLEEIAKVMTFGAKKYADHNWSKGIAYSRLIGAALRHLFAWSRGESKDPESGISHLAHAGCCVVFLIWMEKFRSDLDDRRKDPDNKVGVTTETKE